MVATVTSMSVSADYTVIIEAQKISDNTWIPGSSYKISVKCSGEVITDPNTPVSPSILNTLAVGGSSNTVTLSSFTSVPAACAPTAYQLSSGSTTGISFSSMVATVTNINVIADYTVKIEG